MLHLHEVMLMAPVLRVCALLLLVPVGSCSAQEANGVGDNAVCTTCYSDQDCAKFGGGYFCMGLHCSPDCTKQACPGGAACGSFVSVDGGTRGACERPASCALSACESLAQQIRKRAYDDTELVAAGRRDNPCAEPIPSTSTTDYRPACEKMMQACGGCPGLC